MSGLIAVVLAATLWATSRELEKALLRTGGERALAAADQVSTMMAQGTARGMTEVRRVAGDDAVRRLLEGPTTELDAARQIVRPLAVASQPPVELRAANGALVLSVEPARGRALEFSARVPLRPGLSPFLVSGDAVFYGVVAEVTPKAAAGIALGSPARGVLGYVVVRRVLTTAQITETLNRLVGGGAFVSVGDPTDGVWTNFSKVLAPPPVDRTKKGVTSYRLANGDVRIGAMSLIAGTPWAAWIEFPRERILEPLYGVRRRIVMMGLLIMGVAIVLASAVSARMTKPIRELATAATAIADGDFSPRVRTERRDEIGRLGLAFRAMSERVEVSHRELESRVAERTTTLSEARAVLEERVADLNVARAELDRFFSLSIDLLCIADCDGRLLRVNPAWQHTLGWTAEELTSVPYLDRVHPADRDATSAEAAALANGGVTVHFENRYRTKDGSYRWLSWNSAAAADQGRLYAAARDITNEKATAEALERHVTELKATNDELESFTYSVSHDLRAPLRHVTGFASMLEKSAAGRLSETETRYVRTIVEAASRMGRLIDDLLTFSRMGRSALARRRVSLNQVLREALHEVRGARPNDGVEWTIHALPDVDGDPAMLRLALINLLSNALKYSAGRPHPAIEVGEDGSDARESVIYVRDNGVGFDMQYAHKLFGVFQRLHNADAFEGTGIGLANVRRIVHRHGGRVWGQGVVDRGATFFIALPNVQEASA